MNENHFNLLAAEIRKELVNLQAIAQEMIEYWQPLQGQELSKVDLRVLGSFLHDFYTCIERIFRRIAVKVDGDIPPGEAWHKDLINQMSLEIPNLRPAVIDATLFEQLYEFLRFRHIFRNIYGFELKRERMLPLLQNFHQVYENFCTNIEGFLDFLTQITDE